MIEVEITKEMLEKAISRANSYKNKLNKSILKGEGTLAGELGQEIFHKVYPEAILSNKDKYDCDYILNGKKIEIKAKQRNMKPKADYVCTVDGHTRTQNTDYYVFTSVLMDQTKGWLIGYLSKSDFYKIARHYEQGEPDDDSGKPYLRDTFAVKCNQTKNFNKDNE